MPDIIKVIAVFIIAGIITLDIVNPLLQLIFHSGIVIFNCHKVAVLGRVGRSKYAVHQPGKQRGTGRHPGCCHNEQKQRSYKQHNTFPVPCHKFSGFPRYLLGMVGCGLCRFHAASPYRLCILLFDLLFLPVPGKWV